MASFLQDEAVDGEGSVNYKSMQRFADHMKKSSEASSDFSRKKSLKQQKQFLPIYACRQEVSIL